MHSLKGAAGAQKSVSITSSFGIDQSGASNVQISCPELAERLMLGIKKMGVGLFELLRQPTSPLH